MAKETPFDRARDFVEEKIEQTKEVLGDFDGMSDEVRKTVKSTAKKIEKDYGYLWDDVRRYVKDSPGTAIAISVGIGFFVGYLLRGGDDD
jgi:ElaB/YqjD/DUF883 family membrane-anchored ribosome-binding protein